jgi:CTP synthase
MLSWEQYIYPPMEDSLLTGDVLRIKDGKLEDPMAYRLVLAPSCDLVMRNGKCKVEKVLVAKCKSRDEYLKVVAVQANIKPKDLDKKILKSRITEPQLGGYILLPEYKSVLPSLAVHLRNLEMIPITEISLTDNVEANFKRITSIDSPFREQITWAYLQIAGRPGVPDRDIDKWTKEILEASPSTATT